MFLLPHIIFSALLSLALYPFFGAHAFLAFVGGVFIDVDHYLEYVFRTKNISLRKAYRSYVDTNLKYLDDLKNHRKPKSSYRLHLLHTIELWIVIILASYYLKQYLFLYGVVFHMSMDTAYYLRYKIPYKSEAKLGRAVSLIHYFYKNSKGQ